MSACRPKLAGKAADATHAGFLLDYCLEEHDGKHDKRRTLLKQANPTMRKALELYTLAYGRWVLATATAEFQCAECETKGRMIVGLGAKTVLEIGISLHHTYGVPYIPATALKGTASHYCHKVWGAEAGNAEFRIGGAHHNTLFGTTKSAGFIQFEDAWMLPRCLRSEKAGVMIDVMTPHHGDYYMENAGAAPSDFDDPNPVSFLSVHGAFRIALRCDAVGAEGEKWAGLALKLLKEALEFGGVGAKTASGYGRLAELQKKGATK